MLEEKIPSLVEPQPPNKMSWKEILAALIPFLIYGPIRQIANLVFNPNGTDMAGNFVLGLIIGWGLMILLVLLGCGYGWVRQFPRWFYPYLGVLAMLPCAFVSDFIFSAVWDRSAAAQDLLQALIWAGSLLAFGGLIVLLSRWLGVLHSLQCSLRSDWTQLSLSVAFLAASTFTGLAGGAFNALVPPIFIIIAVTGSLLSREKRTRMLWLLSGLFVSSVFRLAVHTTTLPLVIVWFVLMVLPALINLRPQDHEDLR